MSAAEALLAGSRPLWQQIVGHPFVLAAGDGTLPRAAFDRWLVEDHAYVVVFRRFLAGLAAQAPDEPARELLLGALAPLQGELDLFRSAAAARDLDLAADPAPTTLGYASFLLASTLDGYDVALTVLYAAEKAYHDAWRTVRERAERSSPYWPFIDNWSSDAFGGWVADLAGLLDRAVGTRPGGAVTRAFDRAARFELRFWDAVLAGETWPG